MTDQPDPDVVRDTDGTPIITVDGPDGIRLELREDEARAYAFLTTDGDLLAGGERVVRAALERLGILRAHFRDAVRVPCDEELPADFDDVRTIIRDAILAGAAAIRAGGIVDDPRPLPQRVRALVETYSALGGIVADDQAAVRNELLLDAAVARGETEALRAGIGKFLEVASRFKRDDFEGRLEDLGLAIEALAAHAGTDAEAGA